ncbi:MAG TPA: hypothetical protein PLJ84_12020 [Bacteroidales bacterium]|nr:hypothetical protein [Bacteroidales bacterium]
MNRRKIFILRYLTLSVILIIGFYLGLLIWDKISLPFSNPWGIISQHSLLEYNPANNLVRFVLLILLPSILLFIVYLLNFRNLNSILSFRYPVTAEINTPATAGRPVRKIIYPAILMACTILLALNIPTYHSSGVFDTFHEGESLGSGISYLAGQVPYKDFIFCHGIFQDPLRSVVAFNLFGKSIGSVRTLESINKIIAFGLMSIFIILIYRKNYRLSFLTLIIVALLHTSSDFQFLIPHLTRNIMLVIPRDLTTFSFLITIALIHDAVANDKTPVVRFSIISFLLSFIPFASFIYSVDRGLYLSISYMVISPVLYLCFFRKNRYRFHYLISSFLGILSAVILMSVFLHGDFREFIDYEFRIMPRYKEFMDGRVFRINKAGFMVICFLIAFNAFWVMLKFLQELHQNSRVSVAVRSFVQKYLTGISLLLLSVLIFRNALGRSDWEHAMYSSPLTYILFLYILLGRCHPGFLDKKISAAAIISLTLILTTAGLCRIYKHHLITENFPVKIEDSRFIQDYYEPTIDFLKTNLADGEYFFTMTSEASWYYFIDKPCPTRFPVVWFALPYFYQQEVAADLHNGNVKYILYRNKSWSCSIDGFQNEDRLRIITDYIRQNYVFLRKIDDNEIWIRKSFIQSSN